ncbi:SNF2 helicase associated domain-containing protein [Clostridium folliculivorans]|uniref:Helicase n=1 Tax=Clostridium folliculivorans TaxID=2886038 RepID=A0A9W5Y3J9_9CLOT|nr:SNF2 helicase associated domain-containing protein [Clostridium folliculivorans]GKU26079.1 helicase [Clostridium folliculivorans]GKU28165.1 helicase [Clostridium folliculivorans]
MEEKSILSYGDKRQYLKGIQHYEGGLVEDFSINIKPSEGNRANSYFIETFVRSRANKNRYNIRISLNDNVGFTSFNCDCNFFHNDYRRKGICEHIAAVMVKYFREKQKDIAYEKSNIQVQRIISDMNLASGKSRGKEMLSLQVKLEFNKSNLIESSMEIKIGKEKNFLVRDIKDFLDAYDNRKKISVSKNFDFCGDIHIFSEKYKGIIDVIKEIDENDRLTRSLYNYSTPNMRLIEGRRVYLSLTQLKRVLIILSEEFIDCTINGREYSDVRIVKENNPMNFVLNSHKDTIRLAYGDNIPLALTSKGDILFLNNKIYLPDEQSMKVLRPIIDILKKEDYITFDKGDRNNLMSTVLPMLNKHSGTVNIDEISKEELSVVPLKAKFYIDRDNENIFLDVHFCYGEHEFDSFEQTDDYKEIIRDRIKEQQILQKVYSYGFLSEERLILEDEEKIVEFLRWGVVTLGSVGEVYYSESFKSLKVYTPNSYKGSIRISDKGLLEIYFSIEGVDNRELWHIFTSIKQKKKYYKLKNGNFITLQEKELKALEEIINYAEVKKDELTSGSFKVPTYKGYYIGDIIEKNDLGFIENTIDFDRLYSKTKNMDTSDFNMPDKFDFVMRDYQKDGFKWFNMLHSFKFGGILADEMGLGKTLQTIAFLSSLQMNEPSLIIVPSSLVYNWKDEFEKFAPDMKVAVVQGDKRFRETILNEYKQYDVIVTSYALLRRDIELYEDKEFSVCIIDEAQNIKNYNSQNAKSVKKIIAVTRFALTGTPIENNLGDLWSIFDFVMPSYLMNKMNFSTRYEAPIMKDRDTGALEELNRKIKPFILRRSKNMVLEQLPPKIEYSISVDMIDKQKKIYAAYSKAALREFEKQGIDVPKIKVLGALTRLRQICSDPSVLVEGYKGQNGKLEALMNIIENAKGNSKKVLVFSSFTTVLKNIALHLEDNYIDYLYLDGDTEIRDRTKLVKEFNNGDSVVFLISLKAGGTGLNITGAEVVVHYDPWWNPAIEEQATDRAHRIGQLNTVEVIKLITRGTIEERVYDLQRRKKKVIEKIIGEDINEYNALKDMSLENIKDLFK